jgi:arylsulfatase A-like enzyme
MTGRLPIRSGTTSVPLPGQGHYGLVPWKYTLGELFSDAGYATALYGKWHLGEVEGQLPTDQGKVVFRYAETFDGPIIKPQFPMVYDLIDDPGEQINLTSARMDMMWMYGPAIQRLMAFQKSFAEYPNIKPGQEFDGYG